MSVAYSHPTANPPTEEAPSDPAPSAVAVPHRLYAVFLLTYLVAWALFLYFLRLVDRTWPPAVSGIDLMLFTLATFRLTAMLTEEKVARWLRAPFCERIVVTREDGTCVEEEVPAGRGLRRVAGEFILCPWCAGVWIATVLVFLRILLPGTGQIVLLTFGVAAGGLLWESLAKLMDRYRHSLPE